MPKTRNVTRAQWDAANASTSTRRRRNQKESAYENEKENAGRVPASTTRSHTRSRTGTTPLGRSNTTVLGARAPAKGKGKPLKAPLKQKKMPLQDITHQFLPAPEAANRGEQTQDVDDDECLDATPNVNRIVATVPLSDTIPPPKFASPLPPSSPPSESVASPLLHEQSVPKFLDNLHYSSQPAIPQEPYDPWTEFDAAHAPSADSPAQVSSNSDPFGFVSLERKLKAEREIATLKSQREFNDDEDDFHVLVADTSSPRPVRRLKLSAREEVEPVSAAPELLPRPPTCAAPPTPHKDKDIKRRLSSHEGRDIFSPCASSIESSPSPLKTSARKRPAPNMHSDPLDEFNEELDRSYDVEKTLKKARSSKQILESEETKDEDGSADPQSVRRKLRPREERGLPEEKDDEGQIEIKRSTTSTKARGSKKPVNKARSVGKKEKAEAIDEEGEDLEEKWELERQERIEYFKRLEDYHVEEEAVYLI